MEIIQTLNRMGDNKSEIVNGILKRALITKEGIDEQIKHLKEQIEMLTQNRIKKEEQDKKRLEEIPEPIKERVQNAGEVLSRRPDKLEVWRDIINREFGLTLTTTEFVQLMERWTPWKMK